MSRSRFDQRILDAVGHELQPGHHVRRRGEQGLLGKCLFVWPMHWLGNGSVPEIEIQGDRVVSTHRPARQTADGHYKFDLVLASSPSRSKSSSKGEER